MGWGVEDGKGQFPVVLAGLGIEVCDAELSSRSRFGWGWQVPISPTRPGRGGNMGVSISESRSYLRNHIKDRVCGGTFSSSRQKFGLHAHLLAL
jgi:hypothetical protein